MTQSKKACTHGLTVGCVQCISEGIETFQRERRIGTMPVIRNVYQKVKIGDLVGWRNMGQIQTGKVTSKQPFGFLAVIIGEDDKLVASSDVILIERPGVGRIN